MGDEGWGSWEDSSENSGPPPVYRATFSRGGGGFRGRGGGRRDDRPNDGFRRGQGGGNNWDRYDQGVSTSESNGSSWDNRRGGGSRGGGRGRGGGGFRRDEGSSSTMTINSSDVGRIIGKGGSKIRELESDSGAEIRVEKNSDSYSEQTQVTLRGSPESQAKAKELIDELVSDVGGRGGGSRPYGGFRGGRGNNSRDFSNIPTRRNLEDVEPVKRDWDEVN